MQLKIGDLVVHPAFGIGHIAEIEEKQFSKKGATRLYYEGSFRGVCKVMRDLTAWNLLKPLSQADTTILQKTRLSLYEEWATAAGVSATAATSEVDMLLQSR